MGNEPYKVPIVRGWQIFQEALKLASGLARQARFVMSLESGKVEVLAVDEQFIYLRYLQAKDTSLIGRFMVFHRDDEAHWFDDLRLVKEKGSRGDRFW